MEMREYLLAWRKHWRSALVVVLVAGAVAGVAVGLQERVYTARSQVYVSVRTGGTTTDLLQGSNFTQRQVKSYTDLVRTPLVLDPVVDRLGLRTTAGALAQSVRADSPLDTSLITIQATRPDPAEARDIAEAAAESLAEQVTALEQPEDGPSPVVISVVQPAALPTVPSAPHVGLTVALGLLAGLALGLAQALLRESLDSGVRSADDLRASTDAAVLALMPHDRNPTLVVRSDPRGARAESFRRLRTNLQFFDMADGLRTVAVTSALRGEGKSTVAANLALALAEAGSRVVLVDGDLRRPSVAGYLGVEGSVGLSTVLIGRASLADVVQPWGEPHLHVLPAGAVPPNPSELVGSASMVWVLRELAAEYDFVVVDTPPLLPVTDAAILARLVDGAIMVAGAGRVRRHDLEGALAALETVGARLLGVVLNHLSHRQRDAYLYADAGSGTAARAGRGRRLPRLSRLPRVARTDRTDRTARAARVARAAGSHARS